MKQFKNLEEAFGYQSNCPFCNEPIEANYKERIVNGSWDDHKVVTVFTLHGGDDISIDYYTNEVLSYREKRSYSGSYNISGNATITTHTGNYTIPKGIHIFGVSASCGQCAKYGYTLQIVVEFDRGLASGIFLNSESVSIEEGSTLHEIKNVYATEKTEYDKFTQVDIDDGIVKMSGYTGRRNSTITFPLMPLDIKNPQALLNRIKNLIAFS